MTCRFPIKLSAVLFILVVLVFILLLTQSAHLGKKYDVPPNLSSDSTDTDSGSDSSDGSGSVMIEVDSPSVVSEWIQENKISYPYPPPRDPDPSCRLSTTYCSNRAADFCPVVVSPLDLSKDKHLSKINLHYVRDTPPMDDMPPILIFTNDNPGYIPSSVLIEPGSECRSKGSPYDCDVMCPVKCTVTSNGQFASSADAVLQLMTSNLPKQRNDQFKVLIYTEPYLQDITNKDFVQNFDLIMHWHRSAHIKLMSPDNKYFVHDELEYDQPGFPEHSMDNLCCDSSTDKVDDYLISWAQNNCGGERIEVVKELIKYLNLASYGPCMNNRSPPDGGSIYQTKVNMMSQHKFCLTFENLFGYTDWVTEKVFHSLAAGCIPVYWGAPNIEEYLPCDNCIIMADKFKSIKDLADYLIYLDNHPEEYAKYMEYKKKPLLLKPTLQASKRFSFCAACTELSRMKKTGQRLPKIVFSNEQKSWVPL